MAGVIATPFGQGWQYSQRRQNRFPSRLRYSSIFMVSGFLNQIRPGIDVYDAVYRFDGINSPVWRQVRDTAANI